VAKFPLSRSFIILVIWLTALSAAAIGQTQFRIGERVTYTVSFDKFNEVAYGEIFCVSRGALSGKDAIELRSKFKTLNLLSATTAAVDESRIVFVDPATGNPLYSTRTDNSLGLPSETVRDSRQAASSTHDLL
jgi:hypothetical protein